MAKAKKRSGQKAKKRPSKALKKIVTEKKIKKATNWLLYSGVTFILSLFLYIATTNDFLESLFGFIMVISGALVLLFLVLELIYYFLKKK